MTAPAHARARVTLADADRFTAALLSHLESHATVVHLDGGARIVSPYGTVLLMRHQTGLNIEAICPTRTALATVRTFLADHILEFAADARIVWSGDGAGESRPQQFQKLEVVDAFAVTPRMRRILFACENAEALAGDAHHHIRLLIPSKGRVPVWPGLLPDGRLDWPEGADALASRVYTLRRVDIAASTIIVDIALDHGDPSAPGADFARRATKGDPVGLLGPGGSGLPNAGKLLLFGDETALPAIARIAQQAGPTTLIDAVIEVEDAAETAYLPERPGLTLTWLCRNTTSDTLPDLLQEKLTGIGDGPAFVWAGCEQRLAQQLRRSLKGISGIDSHVAAYWRRSDA